MFFAGRFLSGLDLSSNHPVSTRGSKWYSHPSLQVLGRRSFHSFDEKSIIKRTIHHVEDRTESCYDYFPWLKDMYSKSHQKLVESICRYHGSELKMH